MPSLARAPGPRAPSSAEPDLLSRLLELARDERSPPCIRVRAKNSHTLSAVDMDIGSPLEDHVLNAARHLVRNPVLVKDGGGLSSVPLASHLDDLTTWLDALDKGDLPRACHAVVGIVLS